MVLRITVAGPPATDLGCLLHKNPARWQSFELRFGKAHGFHPEVREERCTAALLPDVESVAIIRSRSRFSKGLPDQYVNVHGCCSEIETLLGQLGYEAVNPRLHAAKGRPITTEENTVEKIPTIFNRNWEGHRGVIDQYVIDPAQFVGAVATEKIDGTNVRLTIRNHFLVRLEKRRNPDKAQKAQGITEPWYVDANETDPADKAIWEAARNTNLSQVPDGEWSGEAVGPKIQGNPLHLEQHTVVLFSLPAARELLRMEQVPTTFEELSHWLPEQDSKVGRNCRIEGIVWHCANGSMMKIKTKDFK